MPSATAGTMAALVAVARGTPHDHRVAARHRPVQVHDDAGRAASFSGRAGRVPVQMPHAGVDLTPYYEPRSSARSPACAACVSRTRARIPARWRFLKSDFVDLLGLFQLDQDRFVTPGAPAATPGEIDIAIKGPWLHTILFEVPVLAIVSEVYFRETQPRPDFAEGRRRLDAKIAQINAVPDPEFRIADYGTRRRFSRAWQDEVVRTLKEGIGPKFVGTSNVKLALDHGPDPAGHDGARVPAGVPGGRAAAARFAGLRVQHMGARIPRRPGDRAVRRLRHGRLSARFRPFLLQAVRRRAPRLGRPVRVGREAASRITRRCGSTRAPR